MKKFEDLKAYVLNPDARAQDGELIQVRDHRIQFGGSAGDGFCYAHQSFDCVDNLTDEEKKAVREAQ